MLSTKGSLCTTKRYSFSLTFFLEKVQLFVHGKGNEIRLPQHHSFSSYLFFYLFLGKVQLSGTEKVTEKGNGFCTKSYSFLCEKLQLFMRKAIAFMQKAIAFHVKSYSFSHEKLQLFTQKGIAIHEKSYTFLCKKAIAFCAKSYSF